MQKKKLVLAISTLLLGGLTWYLFIKPYDYTIRFNANTSPGTINQTLKFWNQTLDTIKKVEQNENLLDLTQTLTFGDSIYSYSWNIKALTDSTSKVQVNIKDLNHSFMNKIKVVFLDTDFEKRSRKTVLDFMNNLDDHIHNFKVTIEGESETPAKHVAYLPIETSQFKKAQGMMKNSSYIEQTLLKNNIQFDGPPMIEITSWNQDNDQLKYNFCYPIIPPKEFPKNTEIKYKKLSKQKAIKAIYNGNYITSDRAWYALIDYAKSKNISVEPKPIEIFYNNPNTGGDELNWKAEVYIPIIINKN